MYFRARKKVTREVSLYEPIGTDREGNEISLLDVIEAEQKDYADQIQLQENIGRLRKLLFRVLDKRELEIICLRYGIGCEKELTQREIGQRLNISRSYISRIEKRALGKLRDALTE